MAGAQTGKNAVENNLFAVDMYALDKKIKEAKAKGEDINPILEEARKKAAEEREKETIACQAKPDICGFSRDPVNDAYNELLENGIWQNIDPDVANFVQRETDKDNAVIDRYTSEVGKDLVVAGEWAAVVAGVSTGLSLPRGKNTGTTVKNENVGIAWGQGNMKQGMPWEDYVGASLPSDARLPKNFKTFDYYDGATKTAVSAKSLDTQTAAKLANPKQIFNSIKGNVDAAAKFENYELSGQILNSSMISNREVRLAIPAKTTNAQWTEINRAIEYGKSRGVKVTVTQVK
ncbi:MAG TPA: hypothetical protein DDY57_17930 [Franconibacter pulveris]|nr:hypothetical protein [Franconibacter pulveris]